MALQFVRWELGVAREEVTGLETCYERSRVTACTDDVRYELRADVTNYLERFVCCSN